MSLTINQIIKQFREIAQNHKQINTFGFGDLPELGKSESIVYPLMWVIQKPSSIDNNDLKLSYEFIFADLVHKDLSNGDEVISDQMLTALDVIAQLQHPSYQWEYSQGAQLEMFEGKWDDEVTGWILNCTITVANPYNRCAIPFEPTPTPIVSDGVVTIFDQDGNIIDYVSNNGSYVVQTGGLTCETMQDCAFVISMQEQIESNTTAIENKVDKIDGKGLSTNDFTNELKTAYDDAVTKSHTHSNKNILDLITEEFTTALKTAYDSVVTWVSTNGTNLINHLTDYNNPHQTTATQVDALKRDGSNANSDVDIDTYSMYAKSFHIKGTGGAGHLGLKHQSTNATANANEISLFAKATGLFIKNDGSAVEQIESQANKGIASGYVPLNSSTKIDLTYFPDAILGQVLYGGTVDASTAIATLTTNAKNKLGTVASTITLTNNATAITGYVANEGIYYITSVAGTFAGISFEVGDWLISIGSAWKKVDNTDAVISVNGQTGVISITPTSIGAPSGSGTSTGTNTGDETTSTIGALINGATSATPNDTDLVATAESSVLKKITWTNVKAFLKIYFDTIYTTTSAVATQITTALSGYATQAWVTSQGYITSVVTALGYTPLNPANNLSDVNSASTSRTNLGIKKSLFFTNSAELNTASSTTYYWGTGTTTSTLADLRCFVFSKSVTLTNFNISVYIRSTLATSGNVTFGYRKNGSNTNVITTVSMNGIRNVNSANTINVSCVAGDTLEVFMITPSWGTAPAGLWMNIEIEYTY